ncbi:MAG: response regulator [Desulfosudaceae bacterium]
MSAWDFTARGPVAINGEWEFYPGSLYTPRDLNDPAVRATRDFIRLPGLWRGSTAQGHSLSPRGQGTYHLSLRLAPADTALSLYITGCLSVGRVWIDGVPAGASGLPGKDRETERPEAHLIITDFYPVGQTTPITLQVSNHHNLQGGVNAGILLGTRAQIRQMAASRWVTGAFMSGALLIMGLYHLVLFMARRSEKANFYFALYCLLWCVATLFSPTFGFWIDRLLPFLPWQWSIDGSLLPHGLTIPLIVVFYHSLFPKKYEKQINTAYLALGGMYILYILATPPNAYDLVPFWYFIITRTAFIYLFAAFALDLAHRRKGAVFLIPGYLALAYSEFAEILNDLNLIDATGYGPIGVFIFILSYSFFMSARFAATFNRVEKLSEKLEAANTRLRHLNQQKDEFLVNTAHELKTPLTGMIGIAETLLAGAGDRNTSAAREHLRMLAHSGKRLSRLVGDVLDLSRLTHKDIALNPGPVSLHDAAQRVMALCRSAAAEKHLVMTSTIDPDLPLVRADVNRLEQILFNLVGNSIKYTEAGGVTLSAAPEDGWVRIFVSDTGIGISKDDQQRIFESYEQVSMTGSTAPGGAGLGLAITRRLVALHGGSIRLASAPGRGSTFSFALPLEKGEAVSAASRETRAAKPLPRPELLPETLTDFKKWHQEAGRDYQVLVVDDEPINLHVIAACLQLAEMTFKTAADGAAALDLIAAGDRPGLVLLDIMMPKMDGFEVCRRLRQRHPAAVLPVIMLTVRDRVEDVVAGLEAGANDYLTKPFARQELIARIKTQVQLKSAYMAMAENVRLKKEVSRRQKTEQDLRLMQQRLSGMLDTVEEPLLAVNASREIGFCNQALETLSGQPAGALLGRPLIELLATPDTPACRSLLDFFSTPLLPFGKTKCFEDIAVSFSEKKQMVLTLIGSRLDIGEEAFFVVMLRFGADGGGRRNNAATLATLRELSENRKKIQDLENTLMAVETGSLHKRAAVREDLKALDALLEKIADRTIGTGASPDRRDLAVRVMNLALAYWIEASGLTKADLAEQSGIWRVYMEKDGYVRTQTLDKYLSEVTLPRRPRWKNIFDTADFVLSTCTSSLPARASLEQELARLKQMEL